MPRRLTSAREHHARQRAITVGGVAAARRARRGGQARVAAAMMAYQAAAVAEAETSLPRMLAEQGIDAPPVASVARTALVGRSALGGTVLDAVRAVWESTAAAFDRMVATELQDVGRNATGIGTVIRPALMGHVRYLNPPSCARCTILAGRFYRWSDGFLRHPMCFPAGVVVSGPSARAASRRWYEGELTIIRTASGQELPATGNHPILTDRGWVPANLLQEGDYVLCSTLGEGAVPLVVPYEHEVPARIEDLWGAGGVVALSQVPTTAEDFHGDGGDSEVDVVLRDGLLGNWGEPALAQLGQQEKFASRIAEPTSLALLRTGDETLQWLLGTAHGGMGSTGLGSPFVGGHSLCAHSAGSRGPAGVDALTFQAQAHDISGYAESPREAVLTFARDVRRGDVGIRQEQVAPRWDAPAGALSVENRSAYASRGLDLRKRLTSQVAADRIVELRRVGWSGHVYNLTSAEGWYAANGLIVSNCDCVMVPTNQEPAQGLVADPMQAFRAGQVRGLSQADTQAVEDGADLGRVVNVRSKAAGLKRAGRVLDRGGRPTPEAIYRLAASREDALALLERHGYIR